MTEISVNYFRDHLKIEVDKCIQASRVLRVKRRKGEDFVVLSAKDWQAIEETLYLNQMPGMVSSIHKAHQEAVSKRTALSDLDW